MNIVVAIMNRDMGDLFQYACSYFGFRRVSLSPFSTFFLSFFSDRSRARLKLVNLGGTAVVDSFEYDGMFELYSSPACVFVLVSICEFVMRLK